MRIFLGGRKKLVDLEAKLSAPDGAPGFGKVTYKRYEDGGELLRVSVPALPGMPRRSEVEITVDGEPVLTLPLFKGRGKVERTERSPEGLVRLREGQRVEVLSEGTTRLAGTVQPD